MSKLLCYIVNRSYMDMINVTQALNNRSDFWWQSNAEFTIAQIRVYRSNCLDVTMLKVVQIPPAQTVLQTEY